MEARTNLQMLLVIICVQVNYEIIINKQKAML